MTESMQDMAGSTKAGSRAAEGPGRPRGARPRPAAGGACSALDEELEVARELVRSARERGTALTGPDGLLKALTKRWSRPRWMRR